MSTRERIRKFDVACKASDGLSVWDLIDREVLAREDKGWRFFTLRQHFENLGYEMKAAPLIGCYDEFCDNLQVSLQVVESALVRVRKDWKVRGYSKNAMARLHKSLPAVGMSVQLSEERRKELGIDAICDRLGCQFEKELRRHICAAE